MHTSRPFHTVLLLLCCLSVPLSAQSSRWEPAHGPYGSRSEDIIQTTAGTFLLNDERNGVWRSTDRCAHWEQSTTGMVNRYVTALALLSDGSVLAGNLDGPYRSTDDGVHWIRGADGLPGGDITIKGFVEASDGTVFLCSWGSGIYRSTDHGRTWSAANLGLTEQRVYCLHRTSADHLFAGTYGGGVFRSVDGGDSWTSSPLAGYVYSLASSPAGVLFASGYKLGVHRSTDDGNSWVISDEGIRNTSGTGFASIDEQVILHAVDAPQGMRQSTDGGLSWLPFANNFSLATTHDILRFPDGDCYATIFGDAVYRLPKDSAIWRPVSNGVQGSWIFALEAVPGVGLFAGGYGGVYLSRDAGESWGYVDRGVGFQKVTALLHHDNALYAVGTPGAVRRSTDHGMHWETLNAGIPGNRAVCICVAPDGRLYLGTDSHGMFTSTDRGQEWTPCNSGLEPTDIRDVCTDAGGRVFAATPSGLYVSTDAGMQWTRQGVGLPDGVIQAVHADDGMLYVGAFNGLYVSSDRGQTCTQTNAAQIYNTVYAVDTDPTGAVLTAAINRCFRSTDHGTTWEIIGQGLPYGAMRDVIADAQGRMFIATDAHGVYRLRQSAEVVEVTVTTAPPGRRITVDGQVYSHAQTFSWPVGSSHEISTTTPQQGSPGVRSQWNSWSNGQPITFIYVVGAGPAVTLTANFDLEYSLIMAATPGGTVSPGTVWQAPGTPVLIRATADAGHEFARWEGSGPGAYSGTGNPVTITINGAVTETAHFRQVTGTRALHALPRTIVLERNSPNPTRGMTTFHFGLPAPQLVTLRIIDLLGRERVRVVDRERLDAGMHTARFDAASLPPGVYLYRLDAESGTSAGRMVVIR